MQFLSLLSATLALPMAVFSLPSQGNTALEARAEDWKTELGWDGTVSPVETVGTFSEGRDVSELEQLGKRTPGGLFLCQAFGFGVPCAHVVFSRSGDCLTLSNEYRFTLSAVGPDPGTTCYLYWSQNCSGTSSVSIFNPGGNLQGAFGDNRNYWGQWNDFTGSIKCEF